MALQQDIEKHEVELATGKRATELKGYIGTIDEKTASMETVKDELDKKEKIYADYEEKKASLERYAKS